MGFGYEVKGLNDRKVSAAKKLVDLAGAATFPGALLVNDLPFRKCSLVSGKFCWRSFAPVRHIPEWLPWLSYKPLARHGYNIGQQVLHEPMEFVRESIVSIGRSRIFESSLSASGMGLLNRHLLSRICERRRNWRDQSEKMRRKSLRDLLVRWI